MKKALGIRVQVYFGGKNGSTFAGVPCASQEHADECQP